MWLGGYRGADNEWYWKGRDATDTPMTTDAWVTDEPNNCCGGQGCLTSVGGTGYWSKLPRNEVFGFDDNFCTSRKLMFICERDTNGAK